MKYLILAACLSLVGCVKYLTYEQVKEQSAYCVANGLTPQVFQTIANQVYKVRCIDKDGAQYVPQTKENI